MIESSKILGYGNPHICEFCGEEISDTGDSYDEYYACECDDAKKVREINTKIKDLEQSKPKPKFRIEKRFVLHKIK